jgi:DNA-binding beta-propeller fold protein YncE
MSIARKLMSGAGAGGDIGAWDLSYAYYDDPFAWDISTAVFKQSFSVSSQESVPIGVFFKPDGTKMYVLGFQGRDVNEYSLSTAWDVSTASYVQNFSVSAQDTAPRGLFFKPDGLKMYVVGNSGDDVNEYSLSTAWDISTATYNQSFSVSAQNNDPIGLFFGDDGRKMYMCNSTTSVVDEYSLSTAWDISTAAYNQSLNVSAQDTRPYDIFFKPDGTKMYVLGNAGLDVNEYDLNPTWDISTASYSQNFDVSGQESTPYTLFFHPDGAKMYVLGSSGDDVNEYNIGGFDVSAKDTSPQDLFFSPDGVHMYVLGLQGLDVNQYVLGTAWDVSTSLFLRTYLLTSQDTFPFGISFRPDGLKMYMVGNAGDDINEYDLSTAWDISTASYVQNFSVASQETAPRAVAFKPDGTKMYMLGAVGQDVNEYSLSTAWNISTASYVQNFSVSAQQTSVSALFFRDSGLQMYIAGSTGDKVDRYDLSTAWDISTASHVQSFSVAQEETSPTGLFFKDDGTKMYVVGTFNDRIYTYTLGVQE